MISQSTIEEIKERASLLDVVGESVQLKRSGSNFSGLCPFHSEDSPSFHIRDNGRYYHCFGCGASGNVISFIMESRGLSFPDAVEEIASRFGIEVKKEGGIKPQPDAPHKEVLLKINQEAFEFFRANLENADTRVIEYVRSRGLTNEALLQFGIGFAPMQWGQLTEHLQKLGFPNDLLLTSGLVRRSPKGDLFDAFRGRLIFPVWIESRKIAGFGGRLIPPLVEPSQLKSSPKYINSPETPVYKKNQILYGLPHSLESIRRSKEAFLVEGYVDVIGLWQVGVKNALAPCGTAVSDSHVRRLQHLVQRVTVLFDGDDAGRAAAARCFELFLNSGIDAAAVFLPQDEDPDTIAKKQSHQTLQYLNALPRVPLIDCYIEGAISRSACREAKELGAAARGKIADEIARILKNVSNAVEQSDLLQRAAMKLLVEPEVLARLVNATGHPSSTQSTMTSISTAAPTNKRQCSVEELPPLDRELLYAVIAHKDRFAGEVMRDHDLCEFLNPWTLSFIGSLHEILSAPESSEAELKDSIKALLGRFGESWLKLWRRAFEMLENQQSDFTLSFEQCRVFVKKSKLKQILNGIDKKLAEAQTESEKNELSQERLAITKQMSKLNNFTNISQADL